jgi:enamine deaminase RidA (YjgF/YER057c/UK114 family)
MSLHPVNPPGLAQPSGFAHAIVAADVPAGARLVFLAGQTAQDASGSIVAPGDIAAQFEQALANLLTALSAAGGRPEDLASLTIYATDLVAYRAQGRQIGQAWRRLAGRRYPAMAAIGVARLWDETALVEIQGIAVVPTSLSPSASPID